MKTKTGKKKVKPTKEKQTGGMLQHNIDLRLDLLDRTRAIRDYWVKERGMITYMPTIQQFSDIISEDVSFKRNCRRVLTMRVGSHDERYVEELENATNKAKSILK